MAILLMATDHDAAMARAIVLVLAHALDHDPNWRVRLEAARNLGLAAPSREEAQGVMSRHITRHAGLGQSAPGNEDAVEALVRAASGDPRYYVRAAACDSLQNVAAAVPGLVALLRSAPPQGRAGAATALGSVGQAAALAAVPELLDILAREPERVVRREIARALFHLLLAQDVTPWIDRLASALRDPDDAVRDGIAWGLTHAGPAGAR